MTVIIVLKETRQTKGMSRQELADRAEISVSYVEKLEQNKPQRVSFDILDRLCNVLECGIDGVIKHFPNV